MWHSTSYQFIFLTSKRLIKCKILSFKCVLQFLIMTKVCRIQLSMCSEQYYIQQVIWTLEPCYAKTENDFRDEPLIIVGGVGKRFFTYFFSATRHLLFFAIFPPQLGTCFFSARLEYFLFFFLSVSSTSLFSRFCPTPPPTMINGSSLNLCLNMRPAFFRKDDYEADIKTSFRVTELIYYAQWLTI